MIGDGPERRACIELATQLNLNHCITWIGHSNNPISLLTAGTVYLHTSESESLGLSVLEAMSCGLPVVSTNVGGIPEIIQHGHTGMLAPLGDNTLLAQQIINLLENPGKARRMGQASKQHVQKYFPLDSMLSSYIKLYHTITAH